MPQITLPKLSQSTWIMIAVVIACVVAIFFSRRTKQKKRSSDPNFLEGFQTTLSGAAPESLVGNEEVCRLMKNIMDSVNTQLQNQLAINNPPQLELLKTTKASLDTQYKELKCA